MKNKKKKEQSHDDLQRIRIRTHRSLILKK